MKQNLSIFKEGIAEISKEFSISEEQLTRAAETMCLKKPKLLSDGKNVEFFHQLFVSYNLPTSQLPTARYSCVEDLAYMIDCSRNAVPKVLTIKKFIRQLAVLGYNTLMLYLEDTFEVDQEPYFGYLRGRFSKEELKEIARYADVFGMEVVPCVQTLAHYNQLIRWYENLNVFDIADVLLVGSPRVRELLDHVFKTLRDCFTTNRLNVGMDEAYFIGRGKYLDQHGQVDRFNIMKEQLDLVNELCQKYGFKPMMWSDMFFRLAYDKYYETKAELPTKIIDLVKGRFDVVYWDYYHVDTNHYDQMLKIHKLLNTNVYFAAGVWKWSGFTPDNRFGIRTMTAGIEACKKNDIPLVIMTGWGDNGAETSLFSILPGVVYASLARLDGIDIAFEADLLLKALSNGLSMEEFMKVDSANRALIQDFPDLTNATNKSMTFNDPLLGVMDSMATFLKPEMFDQFAAVLNAKKYQQSKYAYVFETQRRLLSFLALKTDLGLKLRQAYQSKNSADLKKIADTIPEILTRLDQFYEAFRFQWHLENKPHGFDVQDLRIGGLRQRLLSTKRKLDEYLDGRLEKVDELEEAILDYSGNGKEYTFDPRSFEHRLQRVSSVNVND